MTISPRKLAANRANAKKSTGPRSVEGKRRSSINGLTHGLFSERIVLPDEDASEFARFRGAMYEEISPREIAEHMLFEDIVRLNWRLRRLQRHSNAASALADLDRLSRHEQRLELAIQRCENDFVKLRQQTQKPKQRCAAQAQAAPNDANALASERSQNCTQIERFEPTAIHACGRGLSFIRSEP
jgi:hypothetical protein